MTLPNIAPERLDQMIHTACCCRQDACLKKPIGRLIESIRHKSRLFFYGFGAAAVTASCLIALWIAPSHTPATNLNGSEITFSDYLMQDLLDDLA